MNRIARIAMLSCKQAAILGAKKSFSGLTMLESVKLRMHVKMCRACQDYQKQNKILDDLLTKNGEQKEMASFKLSAQQRQQILESLS